MTYSSPVKHAKVMPQAQVRFRRRFTELMTGAAGRVGAIVLRYAEDDAIPVESIGALSEESLAVIDGVFLGSGGRQVIDRDGRTVSPYGRILLEEIGRATYEIVQAHGQYLAKVLPGDVLLWMRGGESVREMTPLRELDASEVRERFPQLTDDDVQRVVDVRIFEPNRLAEYERAHTWVDPNGYRLSDRIWRVDQTTRNNLDRLLADAIASGQSATQIARLVEQYLIPGREAVRTNRPYSSDGSYDAMRLARTEIARAANQAAYISAYMNPMVNGVDVVRSANGDVNCPVCPQHATIDIGGNRTREPYSIHAANIPPYHPHDMCRVQSVAIDDVRTVENRLRGLVERSREVNLVPVMNPSAIDAFTRQLTGEYVWNILRQVLPVQPGLL